MKTNILFVDDDRSILDSFRTMLHFKRKEWKCFFARTGAEGLAILDEHPVDVVIADMRMPGMDGADFLREVEIRQPRAVRMILSGYSDMNLLLKSVKHAHQFLSKPCGSEVVVDTLRRVTELGYILTDERVRKVVCSVDALPAIPDLFVKISAELTCQEPDIKRIAALVEQDVGISATLMRVVNSSFFGFYETISSPARAVTLLGLEPLKGLILGVHLLKEIDEERMNGYSVEKLWDHCLQTGGFARIIAGMETEDEALIEDCFISGMLHDAGKLVLVAELSDRYAGVVETTKKSGGPIGQYEIKEFGVSHAKVGAYLLGLWGFQPRVVEAVHGHHVPDRCVKDCLPTLAVHVANVLQHELSPQSGYAHSVLDEEWLEAAGYADRLDAWREACMESME